MRCTVLHHDVSSASSSFSGIEVPRQARPTVSKKHALSSRRACGRVVRATGNESGGNPPKPVKKSDIVIGEEILARLKTAEEEAARLKKELAAVQGEPEGPATPTEENVADASEKLEAPRENLFSLSAERPNWLSETDVEFLTGGGPVEGGGRAPTAEEEAIIRRRLLLGLGATAVLGGLALIPTDVFRFKPGKPLVNYLIPLLRIQDLLDECSPLVENGDWLQVRLVLDRVKKSPNNAKENLRSAVTFIETKEKRDKGEDLVRDILEYFEQIDYNEYFDDRGPTGLQGGAKEAQFVKFSSGALDAAKSKLKALLALMPSQALEDARTEMLSVYEE